MLPVPARDRSASPPPESTLRTVPARPGTTIRVLLSVKVFYIYFLLVGRVLAILRLKDLFLDGDLIAQHQELLSRFILGTVLPYVFLITKWRMRRREGFIL